MDEDSNKKLTGIIALLGALFAGLANAFTTAAEGCAELGEEAPKKSTRKTSTRKSTAKAKKEEEEEEEEEEEPEPSHGELADGGDADSISILEEKCGEAEVDPNAYGTWVEVEDACNEVLGKKRDTGKPKGRVKRGAGEEEITLASLREKARTIIRAGHSEEVKELLEDFETESLTTLEEKEYQRFDVSLERLAKKLKVEL